MNKQRRASLNELAEQLRHISFELEALKEEEEEYMNNMPENMQSGEKYEMTEQCCSNLDDACSSLDDAISSLELATE